MRPHGIEFDVAVTAKQIALAIDQTRFVPALPQRAGATIAIIDIAHVTSPQRLHHPSDLPAGPRCHKQVHMIGHQHISMDGTIFAQTDLPQLVQIADAVNILEEARQTIITALHDMLRHLGKIESRLARHRETHAGKSDQLASPTNYGLSDAISRFRQKVHTDPCFDDPNANTTNGACDATDVAEKARKLAESAPASGARDMAKGLRRVAPTFKALLAVPATHNNYKQCMEECPKPYEDRSSTTKSREQ